MEEWRDKLSTADWQKLLNYERIAKAKFNEFIKSSNTIYSEKDYKVLIESERQQMLDKIRCYAKSLIVNYVSDDEDNDENHLIIVDKAAPVVTFANNIAQAIGLAAPQQPIQNPIQQPIQNPIQQPIQNQQLIQQQNMKAAIDAAAARERYKKLEEKQKNRLKQQQQLLDAAIKKRMEEKEQKRIAELNATFTRITTDQKVAETALQEQLNIAAVRKPTKHIEREQNIVSHMQDVPHLVNASQHNIFLIEAIEKQRNQIQQLIDIINAKLLDATEIMVAVNSLPAHPYVQRIREVYNGLKFQLENAQAKLADADSLYNQILTNTKTHYDVTSIMEEQRSNSIIYTSTQSELNQIIGQLTSLDTKLTNFPKLIIDSVNDAIIPVKNDMQIIIDYINKNLNNDKLANDFAFHGMTSANLQTLLNNPEKFTEHQFKHTQQLLESIQNLEQKVSELKSAISETKSNIEKVSSIVDEIQSFTTYSKETALIAIKKILELQTIITDYKSWHQNLLKQYIDTKKVHGVCDSNLIELRKPEPIEYNPSNETTRYARAIQNMEENMAKAKIITGAAEDSEPEDNIQCLFGLSLIVLKQYIMAVVAVLIVVILLLIIYICLQRTQTVNSPLRVCWHDECR